MADPEDQSDAFGLLPEAAPAAALLSGGVITVVALAVAGWGLPLWTLVCAGVMLAGRGSRIAQLPELEEAVEQGAELMADLLHLLSTEERQLAGARACR